MNTRTFVRLAWLVLVFTLALSGLVFAQTTYFVNNQVGQDGYNGLQATPAGDGVNGPKLTIANAIAAAVNGDVISVAYTGVAYGNLATGAKTLTFTSTGGSPAVANITIGANTTFTAPFTLAGTGTLTLTAGAVTNANNITINSGASIVRDGTTATAGVLDVAPAFAGTVNVTYSGASKTIGPELPTSTSALNNLTGSGAFTFTVNRDITVNGTLTVDNAAGVLALGSNTLTLANAGGAVTHTNVGNITSTAVGSGGLNIVMSGGNVTFNPGAGRLPNLTVSYTGTTIRTLTINGPLGIDGNVTVNSGTVALTTPTGATGITGSLTNNGAQTVTVSSAMTIGGNVSNSSTGVITFLNVNITVTGNVSNSGALSNSSNTAQISAAANINFGDGVVSIGGSVTNSVSFAGTTSLTGGGNTTGGFATSGNITFGSTTNAVTITGLLTNSAASTFTLTGAAPDAGLLTGNGRITFANTSGNVTFTGGVRNSSNGFTFAGTAGNGTILFSARAAGTVTVGTVAANQNVENNSANTGGTNGNIDFTAGATGAITVNGNVSLDASAGTGDIIFGAGAATVTGSVSNARTVSGAVIQFNSTGTNVSVGSLSQTGAGSITFASTTGTLTVTTGGNVTIGAGTISTTATSGTITINGAYTQTGGTFSAAAVTTATLSITGNASISGGTLNHGGTSGAGGNITVSGDFSLTAGTLTLGGGAKNFTVTGATSTISPGVTITGAATTLVFNRAVSAQTLTSGVGVTWPGHLNINNTFPTAPTWSLLGGNLIVGGNVTFTSGGAANGVALGSNTIFLQGNFVNNSGYTASSTGFVTMQGAGAQTVDGTGSFSNIACDNAAGVTFTDGTGGAVTYTITGIFHLTNGTVAVGAGLDVIAFNNATSPPTIVRNAGSFAAAPTFTSNVSVTYIGGSKTFSNEVPGSGSNKLTSMTIATTGSSTVTANADFEFSGTLTINSGQTFAIGSQVVTANGASIVSNGSWTSTTGYVNLNRATGTTITAAGALPEIRVAAGSSGNSVSGSTGISVGTNPDLTLANGTAAITLSFTGAGPHVRHITTANANNTITLASNVIASGNLTHAAGTISLGDYSLSIQGTAPAITGGATITSSATGKLVFNASANQALTVNTSAATIAANVEMNLNAAGTLLTVQTNPLILSGSVTLTRGTLTHTAAVTISGTSLSLTSNASAAGTGALTFAPATGTTLTVTLAGATTLSNLTINGNVTLAGAAGTLTVSGTLTHTSGLLDFGARDISVATFTRSAGTYAATTGYLDVTTALTQGSGFSIPNLRISGSLTVVTGAAFTVTDNLHLNNATLTHTVGGVARLSLGVASGSVPTITATTAGMLDVAPTFAQGQANYTFTGTGAPLTVSSTYWPTTPTTLANNVTVNMATAGDEVRFGASRTINGNLTLTRGVFGTADNITVTLASGSTVSRTNNATVNLDPDGNTTNGALSAASINLTYTSGAVGNSGPEYSAPTVVNNLTVSSGASVSLNSTRTVSGTATINGNMTVNAAVTTTIVGNVSVATGVTVTVTGTLVLQGDLTISGTGAIAGAGSLSFTGSNDQAITLAAATTIPNVTINKTSAANTVTITGADLTVGTLLTLTNGLVNTGTNNLILGANPGFTRAGVTGSNQSHVIGNLQRAIPAGAAGIGRYEYPVGSSTRYRPYTITFPSNVITGTSITVKHIDSSPLGSVGLPVLDPSTNKRIGGYPDFYWLVRSTISLGASQSFDVELVGTNLGRPFTTVDDLRIIRRFDGAAEINPWSIQGSGVNYSNILEVSAGDSVVTVRNTNSTGGVVTQGARFSIGIPTRPPAFTAAPTTASVNEGSALSLQYTATPQDVGETITYSLVSPPTGASINSSTGAFTWTPTYAQAGNYTITVSATDGEFTTTTTTAVTVVNVNRKPAFAAVSAQTITDKDTLKLTLSATDPDGDALTYSFVSINPAASANPTVTAAGALTWKPSFADASLTYAISVAVTDGVSTGAGDVPGTDTLSISVSVNRSRVRGDVSGDGSISAFDAALVLQHVTGIARLTDAAALFAADASANGTISAFDAALILQHVAGLYVIPSTSLKKADGAAMNAMPIGSLNWSEPSATKNPEVVSMALKLSKDASGIYSVELRSPMDVSKVSLEGISMKLPEGWQALHNVVDGELRIAMAGTKPLSGGDLATVTLRLKDVRERLNFSTSILLNEARKTVEAVEVAAVPTVFALEQNYPNPFNPSTTIRYQLPQSASVKLDIYNALGQKVRTLVSEEQKAGFYKVQWDGRDEGGRTVSTGLYIYRIQAGSFVSTQKMLLMK
ncbi:MAG: T9SS type A sorting domain-containing protein [Ignavibacteria bacterium]|nr:T9SS type A sorting domain-containing protein [Ignavibacteria bacterium]